MKLEIKDPLQPLSREFQGLAILFLNPQVLNLKFHILLTSSEEYGILNHQLRIAILTLWGSVSVCYTILTEFSACYLLRQ